MKERGSAWSVCLVAGEASGDVQMAAILPALAAELRRKRDAPVEFWGCAGPAMRAAGVEALVRVEDLAVMGFAEVLGRFLEIREARGRLLRELETRLPDALVVVDFPAFNLGLCEDAFALGITTIYHIPPKVWAHGAGRAARLRESCYLVTCVLPFEEGLLRAQGVPARFVGNPLKDEVLRSLELLEFERQAARADAEWRIGLLPGSRKQEITRVLPLLLDAFMELDGRVGPGRKLSGLVPVAATLDPAFVRSVTDTWQVQRGVPASFLSERISFVPGGMHAVLAQARYAWVCSGTATLEACFFETPMSVVYRMHPLSYRLAKAMVKLGSVGLVNLCANAGPFVPEFLQEAATPAALAGHAASILPEESPQLAAMLAGLRAVNAGFPPRSSELAASAIAACIAEYAPLDPASKRHLRRSKLEART